MMAPAQTEQAFLDRAGIFLSALCLVHCTVLPLLLAVLQAYGAALVPKSLDNGTFHAVLAFVLLGVGGLAFVSGFRRHRRPLPLAAGAFGTGLLFLGAFNPGGVFPELGEHLITVLGTCVLLFAHAKNRRSHAGHHLHDGACALEARS
jgi:hypothetical protein